MTHIEVDRSPGMVLDCLIKNVIGDVAERGEDAGVQRDPEHLRAGHAAGRPQQREVHSSRATATAA